MRITHIELTDWGPHRHIDADTDSGILGVVGSNGSGKSNLLQAIDYAFTGNLNGRTGASYIRGFGTDGGAKKAVVRIVFKKNGLEGEITREIGQKTSKRCLKWDGCTYSKADEVEKVLNNILGVDKAALANAAFIKQGDIAGIVQGTPAERNDIFRKLVRLWFIDKRSEDLLARQSALESSIKDYSEVYGILVNKIEDAANELKELDAEVKANEWADAMLPAAKGYDKAMDLAVAVSEALTSANNTLCTARESVSAFEHRLSVNMGVKPEELQGLKDKCDEDIEFINGMLGKAVKLSELEGVVTSSEQSLAEYEDKLAKVLDRSEDEQELQDTMEAASQSLMALEGMLGACRACARAEDAASRAEAARDAARDACSGNGATASEAAELRAAAVKATWRRKMYETKLAVLRDPGMQAKCPCCGRDVELSPDDTEDSLSASIAEETAAADDANRMAGELEDSVKAAEAAELTASATCERAVADRHAARSEMLMLLKAAKSRGTVPPGLPENSAEAAAALELAVKEASDLVAGLDARLACAREDGKERRALEAKVEACKSERDRASARISELAGDGDTGTLDKDMWADELKKAMDRSKELHSAIVERDGLSKAVDDADRLVKEAADNMGKVNAEIDKYWTALYKDVESRTGLSSHSTTLVKQLEGFRETWVSAKAKADSVRKAMEGLERERDEVLEKMERNNRRVTLVDDLKKVRAIIGKNGVPMAYMNTVFKGIASLVRDMLPKMGANFSVDPDPSSPMSFTFCRTDDDSGHRMTQDQLSGGQAVRLALALLIACQQVVLPDLGLLVLDEPSSHIDDDGIASMRDMFSELVGVMDSADMQLVIVDHNVNLMSAFGRTVKLGDRQEETV